MNKMKMKTCMMTLAGLVLAMAASAQNFEMKGARVNNLKGINLSIPRNEFIVVTGVSGSGKSSLAFDTLSERIW